MQQVELRFGGSKQGGRIPRKAWIGVGRRGEGLGCGRLVSASRQNGLDGAVERTVMSQRPRAGGL